MQTFIRATEVWVPNEDGSRLVLGTAYYDDMESFRLASEEMSFGYDEGLPGKCWAYGSPIVLKRFEKSYFRRAEIAHVWGLSCGIALPIFSGDFIKAVVVLLCGDTEEQVGAIELWHNDKRVGHDMSLVDGYYGSAELFEWCSTRTKFRKGIGLPGLVWEQNRPILLSNILDSTRFLRHDGALKVGLNKGIGLPFLRDSNHAYVVTLLSARGTPIARRFEIWSATGTEPHRLAFETGDCDINPNFFDAYSAIGVQIGDGAIGKAMISGIPLVAEIGYTDTSIAEMNAAQAGLRTLVAIPIIVDGHLSKMVVWYF